jgi:hypothetical protein
MIFPLVGIIAYNNIHIHTHIYCNGDGGAMTANDQRYRMVRLREEDYQKLKDVQDYLRRKGTDSIDLQELRKQNIVEVPEEEGRSKNDLALGLLLGLGAAALAYLIWRSTQK